MIDTAAKPLPTLEEELEELSAARTALREQRARRLHDRGWLVRRALVAGDASGLLLALVVAGLAIDGLAWAGGGQALPQLALLVAVLPVWVAAVKAWGLYDRDGRLAEYSTTADIAPIANILTLATLLYIFLSHAVGVGEPRLAHAALFLGLAIPLVCLARAVARWAARSRAEYVQNTVIVGAGDVGQALARKLLHRERAGLNVLGFVDADPKERAEGLGDLAVLGTSDDLPQIVRALRVDRVVIAFSNDSHEELLRLLRKLRDLNVVVDIVPRLFDLIGPGVEMHSIEGMPLVGLAKLRLSKSSLLLKRTIDLAFSVPALVLLAPVLALAALAIKLDSRGPVFFAQTRVGLGGRHFRVLKFRTMTADAEERKQEFAHLNRHLCAGGDPRMFKIVNDPRVTRVGRFLRRNFLDELPQLVNVARGEMSLVGPRPLIVDEAAFVDSWGRRRLELKPGMTGPWQVLGRSSISFAEMVKLDYFYVTTWSLGGDLRLLLQTAALVLRGEPPV